MSNIRSPLIKWAVFTALVLAISITQWVCNSPQKSTSKPLDAANYVGINTCASCHNQIYETFTHTGMGSSFDSATQTKSAADFSPFAIYHSQSDLYYTAFWLNKVLYIKEFRILNGDTVYSQVQKIDYIVGSGQHTNSHIFRQNGYLYQAPLTYYTQSKKWDLPPGFNENNSHFSRMLDVECISCHNAMPTMADKTDKNFVNIGKGIDCERCHGPGSAHVDFWKTNADAKTIQHGNYIINPGKLSNDRLIDLCQRCHLQGNNVLKEGKSFLDFKPGMKLSDVFEVYLPKYEGGDEIFDMANHAARLQKSACFIQSKGELTCISCHNPHISVKQIQFNTFNKACQNCHQTKKCTAPAKSLKEQENNCVKCHMPSKGAEDIPHVSVHDHWITKPQEQNARSQIGKLTGLYAVNNPNPAKKDLAKAYLSYFEKFEANQLYRQKALVLLKELNDYNLWIHYYYQEQNYTQIINVVDKLNNSNDELTSYRVGKSYQQLNDYVNAKYWFFKTLTLGNYRPEYFIDYLSICFKIKDLDEAEKWTQKGIAEFPNNAMLWNAKGYLAFLKGNYSLAKNGYLKSLMYNPDLVLTLENLAQLYIQMNDNEMSKLYLNRILKIDSKHPKAKQLLGNLN